MEKAPSPGGPPAKKSEAPFDKSQTEDQAGNGGADSEKNDVPGSRDLKDVIDPTALEKATDRSPTSGESNDHDSSGYHPQASLLLKIRDFGNSSENRQNSNPFGYCPVMAGQVFESRYETIKLIGAGSYGVVWMASDRIDGGYKALKFANADDETEPKTEISNFENVQNAEEARGQNSFVKYYGVFEHQGYMGDHIVMSLEFAGPNLETVRNAFTGLLEEHVKRIAVQTLHALDFLHRKCNMIHGDLKPANIMLQLGPDDIQKMVNKRTGEDEFFGIDFANPDSDFKIKIGDLGFSEKVDPSCRKLIQSCPYRAPEVFLNDKHGPPADIWSLGCMIFDLAAGNILFPCDSIVCVNADRHRIHHLTEMSKTLGKIETFMFASNETSHASINNANLASESSNDPKPSLYEMLKKEHITSHGAEELSDLVKSMLDYDVETRLSAEDALNHEFLAS